jgi:hypothetical protein
MKFKGFVVAGIKMAAFWEKAAYVCVEVDRRFRGVYSLHHPDDGGSMHLRNCCFNQLLRPLLSA